MQTDTVLSDIASAASTLAELKTLRSKAVVIERLMPLIEQAMTLGHKHEAIHTAIQGAGIDMTFGVYKQTLHRVRKRDSAGLHKPESARFGNESERNVVGPVGSGFDKPADHGLSKPESTGTVRPERSQHQEPDETGLPVRETPAAAFDPGNPTAALDRAKNLVEDVDFKSIGRRVSRKGKTE